MRRTTRLVSLAMLLAFATAGSVSAHAAAKSCPNESSGFASIDLNLSWAPGDPIPQPGQDAWWDLTLAGLAAEDLTPATAAPLFGLASAAELYELVVLGIRGLDRNADGAICWRPYPAHQNGAPAYFFNAIDNNAR